ncbi:hypothetical protein D8M04_01945 [Oceanobacillus piezotolerans]|uniref:LysM domain-containing protein n=1 Tax=Oceanobacillus piezotolerans TaxID=2448030 RepID=A0A498DEV8_9BACI|nr:hypothetical protein [Oceanobacillus piezotolerans]RLL48065.1 hypothetical protein D8M04_01945 [Oceanobacillus piezotolerans]
MQILKKYILYIAIILLITSVYKDLSLGTNQIEHYRSDVILTDKNINNYTIIRLKAESGDTLLSIVESINESKTSLSPEKILTDFMELNPTSDPYHIKVGEWYYFPIYE